MDDYLSKPVQPEKLRAILAKFAPAVAPDQTASNRDSSAPTESDPQQPPRTSASDEAAGQQAAPEERRQEASTGDGDRLGADGGLGADGPTADGAPAKAGLPAGSVAAAGGDRVDRGQAAAQEEVLLDWQGAMDRFRLPPDALVRIAEPFLKDCPALLQQMQTAIANGDSTALQRAAHTLKSSADIFSSQSVARLARQLEMKGRENSFEGVQETWQQLDRQAAKLLAAIQEAMTQTQTRLQSAKKKP